VGASSRAQAIPALYRLLRLRVPACGSSGRSGRQSRSFDGHMPASVSSRPSGGVDGAGPDRPSEGSSPVNRLSPSSPVPPGQSPAYTYLKQHLQPLRIFNHTPKRPQVQSRGACLAGWGQTGHPKAALPSIACRLLRLSPVPPGQSPAYTYLKQLLQPLRIFNQKIWPCKKPFLAGNFFLHRNLSPRHFNEPYAIGY
jgi:hypothetical protein